MHLRSRLLGAAARTLGGQRESTGGAARRILCACAVTAVSRGTPPAASSCACVTCRFRCVPDRRPTSASRRPRQRFEAFLESPGAAIPFGTGDTRVSLEAAPPTLPLHFAEEPSYGGIASDRREHRQGPTSP